MNESIDRWVKGEWVNSGGMDVRTDGWVGGWIDGGQTNGWMMYGWVAGVINRLCFHWSMD